MLKFSKDHEWIRVDGSVGTVGITAYAQSQLGDVVFVEVPAAGKALQAGQDAAVVESVKAASDVYSPVDGTVIEGNGALSDTPELVNEDPMGEGWFFRISISNPGQLGALMDEEAYAAYLEELG
ncbi:MAG: glycine cleavage system protein GcvH [Alphaproteobacteria bacterium]|nr:glycine cleavage system protein GcvH [Alphaproteobacteria bacterium]TAD89156.1 MAG: glycine cleavage system protein GcvH [Alphaproteobacteria bacterium]